VPPIYSAIKIDGKRAYELARKKIIPDRIPEREVVIENITLLHFELPEITIEVKCFSGTYIRSLARDIAERLGSCGHLTYLNRMNDGFFNYENSASFEEFISDPIKHICKINNIINFPVFNLEDEIIKKIKNGMECKISYEINDDFVFAADKNNDLIFLCKVKEKNILCPEVYLEDNK
jgi:tRNA pseudouridine55 synthase